MIEYLSIDLETKSGTDLSKSGVYRYTEDPEFEILLFGYSVNGGEVSVIDAESRSRRMCFGPSWTSL